MSVIPFDLQRPFPERDTRDRQAHDAQVRIETLEQSLALLLRECTLSRERAERAERRVESLSAELFRAALADERVALLTKAG